MIIWFVIIVEKIHERKDYPAESIGLKFIPSKSELFWNLLFEPSVSKQKRFVS